MSNHNLEQKITRNKLGKTFTALGASTLLAPGRGGPGRGGPGRGGPGRGQNQRARVNSPGPSFGSSFVSSFGSNTANNGIFGSESPLLPQTSINRQNPSSGNSRNGQNRSSENSFGSASPLLVEEIEMAPPPPPSPNGNRRYNPNSYIGNSSSGLPPSRRASQFNSRTVYVPYNSVVKEQNENRNAILKIAPHSAPHSAPVEQANTQRKGRFATTTGFSNFYQKYTPNLSGRFGLGLNSGRSLLSKLTAPKPNASKPSASSPRTVNNLLRELNILPASINVVQLRNDSKKPEHYISAYLKIPKLNKNKNARLKEIILANYGNKPSTPRSSISTASTASVSRNNNNNASSVSAPSTFTLNKSISNFLRNINVVEGSLEESNLKKIENLLKKNVNSVNIENEDIRKLISAYKIYSSPGSKGTILSKSTLKNKINKILS